ncbi:hypothetical protein [Nigerium massiliense]|uniref:hypothetical protein n=1 Tax=Nigerium massiliense TaxID=1522317 RepID=UPI00058CF619|nr:hypothetical protein [Nigerium massiliense]
MTAATGRPAVPSGGSGRGVDATASTGGSSLGAPSDERARALAAALVAALRSGDEARFARGFTAGPMAALGARLWRNWRAMPVADIVAAGPELEVRWASPGEAVPAGERLAVLVASDGAIGALRGKGVTPLWLGDEVTFTPGVRGGTLASTRVPRDVVAGWSSAADRAARHVSARLDAPGWDGALSLVLPADAAAMARATGRPLEEAAGTAATTVASSSGPPRIVVNVTSVRPDARAGLLAHEGVHVATRSAGSPAPLWAVEGLAESVGTELDRAQSARNAELVRRRVSRGVPAALPTPEELAAPGVDGETAYALAEVAVEALIARDGRAATLAWIAEPTRRPEPRDPLGAYRAALG